jgi:hypothetical protein
LKDEWSPLCAEELRGFFGILFMLGSLRGGYQLLKDFWHHDLSQNSIVGTTSFNRFSSILRFLRFNLRETRDGNDRLAPIRELWTMALRNFRRSIIPGDYVCIDEQMLSTKGRCLFRMYMAGKPHP